MMRSACLILLALSLMACSKQAPPCPLSEASQWQPSAGCLVSLQGKLLVTESVEGKISIPGGSSDQGESPRCAAYRETWEETGLEVMPGQLIKSFDNGFQLFACDFQPADKRDPFATKPFLQMEIKRAFWVSAEQFDEQAWRFPNQIPMMRKWLLEQ